MKIIDANHPFFARAWIRWATALFPVGWAVVEFVNDSPGWGVVFAGMGAIAFWALIVKGPDAPQPDPSSNDDAGRGGDGPQA